MTIALLPDYASSLESFGRGIPWEPLSEAPAYVRSREATRWHRARSGKRYDSGRVSYAYWCGANFGDFGVEEIGESEEICGTCEGRFIAQRDNPWLFTPKKALPPRMCPAGGREDMVPVPYQRLFHCPACGETVGARAISKYYGGAAVVKHEAGPDLVPPCRYHGWNCLRRHEGRVVCGCAILEARAS